MSTAAAEVLLPSNTVMVLVSTAALLVGLVPSEANAAGEPKKLSVMNSDDRTFLWSRERFRPKSHHRFYIAGLPSSGTNFAFMQLFQKNCRHFGGWQPPYVGGKHKFITKNDSIGNDTKHAVLVVVKHPLTWITSMCRKSYFMKINNKSKCLPSPVSFNEWGHQFEFPDLVQVWMDYYSRFRNNASFPVEWVRYEDLLLHPEETTREYCRHPVRKVEVLTKASKSHRANETARADALQKYTNPDTVLADFTLEQLNYVAQSISKHDSDLLSFLDIIYLGPAQRSSVYKSMCKHISPKYDPKTAFVSKQSMSFSLGKIMTIYPKRDHSEESLFEDTKFDICGRLP